MLIGDININTMKPREPKTCRLSDFYHTLGLQNLIKEVTFHQNNSESSIDHIAVNREEMYQLHGIIELCTSDHNLVYCVRKHPKIKKSLKFIWARSHMTYYLATGVAH